MSGSVPAPIGVHLQFTAGEWQRHRFLHIVWMEERPVDTIEQAGQLAFVGGLDHEYATADFGRKAAVVEVIAIQRNQSPAQLVCELVMLHIWSPPEIGILEHEEDVPLQPLTHVRDDASRDIRVGIDARPRHEALDDRSQLLGKGAHVLTFHF